MIDPRKIGQFLMGEWDKTSQPLKERGIPGAQDPTNQGILSMFSAPVLADMLAPVGTYDDGSVGLAWPKLAAGIGDAAVRGYEQSQTALPLINDDAAWAEKSRDFFDAASLAPIGGLGVNLAGGMVDNALGSAGGKLTQAPQGIRAYHGSPHDFDRFSLDKIGTGEGAQAYGHGLYFADSEDVARSYRDSLSADGLGQVARGRLRQFNGDMDKTIEYLQQRAAENAGSDAPFAVNNRQALAELEAAKAQGITPGRMYEVNIKANPEDFLDWDKTIGEQSESVRNILSVLTDKFGKTAAVADGRRVADIAKSIGATGVVPVRLENLMVQGASFDDALQKMRGMSQNDSWQRQLDSLQEAWPRDAAVSQAEVLPENWLGQALVRGDARYTKPEASAILKDAGIPGIKYLDGMSRDGGAGTSNYVVFDDQLVDILRKYANAPTGAAIPAGMEASQGEQDPALVEYLKAIGLY